MATTVILEQVDDVNQVSRLKIQGTRSGALDTKMMLEGVAGFAVNDYDEIFDDAGEDIFSVEIIVRHIAKKPPL